MNIQFIRDIIKKDYFITKFINDNHKGCLVKYSNFGFIVILPNFAGVYKYYLPNIYYSDLGIIINGSFYEKELENYNLFLKNDILVPNIYKKGLVSIGKYNFSFVVFENIRYQSKLDSFLSLDILNLSNFLKKIHSIKKGYIHGNLHQSNFFIKDGKIGIFDFVNYSKGNNEKDISRVIFGLGFNTDIIINFLNIYGFNNINFELLLKEMIILYGLEKKDVKFDFVGFKKTIQLIKGLY